MLRDSNPDFRINPDSDLDVCRSCRIAPKMLFNSLPCRHQSFHRVSSKSAGDCTRNANPIIRYSAMVRKVEKWSGIRIRDRITTGSPKVNTFFSICRPNHNTKFQRIRLMTYAVICIQNDRQSDWLTEDSTERTTSASAEVTTAKFADDSSVDWALSTA